MMADIAKTKMGYITGVTMKRETGWDTSITITYNKDIDLALVLENDIVEIIDRSMVTIERSPLSYHDE